MIADLTSPNFDERPAGTGVDMLVLHYTGMQSAAEALARLTDPEAEVSAHYLVEEDGTVVRLVDEELRAWHAGVSFWRGATNINARSIGVELVNPGHDFGYREFPRPQITSLIDLVLGILSRWPIPPRNVVGHADIAPRRKADPGELFDWQRLARAGIGLWPEEAEVSVMDQATISAFLQQIGYETVDLPATLTAFQRHWRPARVDGRIDRQTCRLAGGLAAMLSRGTD